MAYSEERSLGRRLEVLVVALGSLLADTVFLDSLLVFSWSLVLFLKFCWDLERWVTMGGLFWWLRRVERSSNASVLDGLGKPCLLGRDVFRFLRCIVSDDSKLEAEDELIVFYLLHLPFSLWISLCLRFFWWTLFSSTLLLELLLSTRGSFKADNIWLFFMLASEGLPFLTGILLSCFVLLAFRFRFWISYLHRSMRTSLQRGSFQRKCFMALRVPILETLAVRTENWARY